MSNLFTLADQYRQLRERKKELEADLQEVNRQLRRVELDLANEMSNEEMPRFDRAGHTFYLSTQIYASPVHGCSDELYQWLKEHGYGDLVKETVHSRTLSSFVKELMEEDGLPQELAEIVNVHEKVSVNVRRGRA